MGTGILAVAVVLVLLCNGVSAEYDVKLANKLEGKVDDTGLYNEAKYESVAQQVQANGGCDPNVCFALDGSASIPPPDYELQKNFVQLIAAIVGADPRAMFGAAQYGVELEKIQKLTSNAAGFLASLTQSTFIRAPATFIEPGILYCTSQLGTVRGEPAKLVILGDGRSDIRDRSLASQAVRDFLNASPANEACAVGVGFDDPIKLEQIVGRADRVLEVTDWPIVLNILDDLVAEICGLGGGTRPPPPTTPAPITTTTRVPPGSNCPCRCIAARGPGDREERRAFRRARAICRNFRGQCQVELCVGQDPVAFKCC